MDKADTFINYNVDKEATAKNIRTLMKMTGYSARELEKILNCTQMAFFNWQEGKNLPDYQNLLRLASVLKTPVEKIVVFEKFQWKDTPLKETNSGFVRNNVFFTYNRATECVIRDSMTFKKKFGVYPDKLILSHQTFENWQKRETEEASEISAGNSDEYEDFIEAVPGKLIADDKTAFIKTDLFRLDFKFYDETPENYYRLIKSDMCKI